MPDLPRVTDIIAFAKLTPDYERWDPNRKGIAKGEPIDMGCRLLFGGYKLEDLEVDERILPELTSLDLWLKHTGFKAEAIQEEVVSKRHGFKGHVDARDFELVLDAKSGAEALWHRAQTAGYLIALNERDDVWIQRRGSLYLQKDSSMARFKEHKDRADLGVFLSALKLYQGEKALEQYRDNIKRWLEAA